jgi:hypothetical protein
VVRTPGDLSNVIPANAGIHFRGQQTGPGVNISILALLTVLTLSCASERPVGPACNCPHQGDLRLDGELNTIDQAALIDILHFGAADIQDFPCPRSRADLNCDGWVNQKDYEIMDSLVWYGGPEPCEPCATE